MRQLLLSPGWFYCELKFRSSLNLEAYLKSWCLRAFCGVQEHCSNCLFVYVLTSISALIWSSSLSQAVRSAKVLLLSILSYRHEKAQFCRLYVRCERQTLSRLPKSGAILFTIRTYVRPLREYLEKDKAALRRLYSAVQHLPEVWVRESARPPSQNFRQSECVAKPCWSFWGVLQGGSHWNSDVPSGLHFCIRGITEFCLVTLTPIAGCTLQVTFHSMLGIEL